MIHSNVDLDFYNQGYKVHAFNELVSDRIGYQARPIPDTRPKEYVPYLNLKLNRSF